MTGWPYLALLFPAVLIAADDFRTRRVHVVWLAALGVTAAGVGWWSAGWRTMLVHTAADLVLLTVLLGLLVLWERMRGRILRQFLSGSFGAGDAVCMAAAAPLFDPEGYVRWLIASCCAALVWWWAARRSTIPLAGVMALTLAGWALLKFAERWS